MPRCSSCLYIAAPARVQVERRAGRIEEMPPVLDSQDRLQQLLIVGFAVNRVDRRRVHDQERRRVEVVEEPRVRFAEPLEIFRVDQLLVRNAAHRDAPHQHARRRLQVDDEIGRRRIELERIRHLLVQPELVRIEVELSPVPARTSCAARDDRSRACTCATRWTSSPSSTQRW